MKKIKNTIHNKHLDVLKNKVNSIKNSTISKKETLFPYLSKIINIIHKFIIKIFFLNKIDPKILALFILLFKIVFKGSFYINIAIAVLVFLSHALDLEYKLTWELFTYLIPAIILALKSYLTDFWSRLSSFIKYLLEKFATNLHEVKETVEKDVDKIKHVLEMSEPDPKPESKKYKYFKYGLYVTGAAIIIFGGYYYWDDFTKPVLSAPIVGIKKVYSLIKSCFDKGKGPNPYEPDVAGSTGDIELGTTTGVDDSTSGGIFSIFSRRSNPGKMKVDSSINKDSNSETIFTIGEIVDQFSDTPITNTSRGYRDASSSNIRNTKFNKSQ